MSDDPAILFVKPAAISDDDKATLKAAGVLVIEIDDPANAKFVRAGFEIGGGEMLKIAAQAIKGSDSVAREFGKALCAHLTAWKGVQ